jgi:hypothetical protein
MIHELTAHLETADEPLRVRRDGTLRWADEERHARAYAHDPERYALLALLPGVRPWQRARILLQILGSSWTHLDAGARDTLSRVVAVLVPGLPATHGLTVLLALRHRRANHKHVTRAAVRLLTAHPQADAVLVSHRQVLRAVVEHALGKATARGCAREVLNGQERASHLWRHLYRFAPDPATAAERLRALYSPGRTDLALDGTGHPLLDLDLAGERPGTVTATNRGDIAATLVHRYRGGSTDDLRTATQRYVDAAAGRLGRYPGTLALVLDASGSMRGYGDREWAVVSQVEALRLVLARCCERLAVVPVGGAPGEPGGATDLAGGVLAALDHRPDLVAVVSDGYENVYPGDLARVTVTLPRVGVTTPVVFCHSTYGHSDDLSLRRPAPALPERSFWHEEDFGPLLLWLLARTGTAAADDALTGALRQRLATVEEGLTTVRPDRTDGGPPAAIVAGAETPQGSET